MRPGPMRASARPNEVAGIGLIGSFSPLGAFSRRARSSWRGGERLAIDAGPGDAVGTDPPSVHALAVEGQRGHAGRIDRDQAARTAFRAELGDDAAGGRRQPLAADA